jgi:hypothetical protein
MPVVSDGHSHNHGRWYCHLYGPALCLSYGTHCHSHGDPMPLSTDPPLPYARSPHRLPSGTPPPLTAGCQRTPLPSGRVHRAPPATPLLRPGPGMISVLRARVRLRSARAIAGARGRRTTPPTCAGSSDDHDRIGPVGRPSRPDHGERELVWVDRPPKFGPALPPQFAQDGPGGHTPAWETREPPPGRTAEPRALAPARGGSVRL